MLKILDHLEEWLIAFLMAAATLIIFVAVAQRYAAGVSFLYPFVGRLDFAWAQELCIIMFVWMAKFGAAYGVRTGIHVGIDVLINRMNPDLRKKFIVFGLLSGAVFTCAVGSLGLHFVLEISHTDSVSADLEWPMWMIYSAIPGGSYLMCFRFLQVMVSFIRTGELPHHDHGHVEGMDEHTDPNDEKALADINWFEMDDGLHPKDIAHHEGLKGDTTAADGSTKETRK